MPTEEEFELYNQLREIRKKLRISQQELADYLGKSKSYISKIENGHVYPSLKLAYLIVDGIKNIYLEHTGHYLERLSIQDIFAIEFQINNLN